MDFLSMAFEVLVIGAIAVVVGVLVHKVVENKGKTRTVKSDFELDVPADYTEPTNPIEVKQEPKPKPKPKKKKTTKKKKVSSGSKTRTKTK